MSRIPIWLRCLLGSLLTLVAVIAALLVPAVRQARYAAMKSSDK
ncbi:MAG: hypothetical protein FD138_634 [Planctomycetota bacterium]|nr:MAG: hypothetical protein FD138_634 [Planctomycetota bacterium]